MRTRKKCCLRAFFLRVVLVLFMVAFATVIIAQIEGESAAAKVSAVQVQPSQEESIFAKKLTMEVAISDTSALKAPNPVERYAGITMTDEERDELAAIIYLEARGESAEGQQAVAEVILNRVIHQGFPDSIYEVLHQGEGSAVPQFSTVGILSEANPSQAQYDAIDAALYGPSILPDEVVFFSTTGENDRVWGTIGGHVFCYAYIWE